MSDPLTEPDGEGLPDAVNALLKATVDSVRFLHNLVNNTGEETRERRQAAQALLGLAGVQNAAQKQGVSGTQPTQVSSLLGLLSGRSGAIRQDGETLPYSPWADSARNKIKCSQETCDWAAHSGGVLACGHTREAGHRDACGGNHSMTTPCGTVGHPRSDWWNNAGVRPRRLGDTPAPSEWTAYRKLGIGLGAS